MTDGQITAICAAVPATILALATFLQSLKNFRETRRLKSHVDGKMQQLLDAKEKAARAEGKLDVLQTVVAQPAPPRPPES